MNAGEFNGKARTIADLAFADLGRWQDLDGDAAAVYRKQQVESVLKHAPLLMIANILAASFFAGLAGSGEGYTAMVAWSTAMLVLSFAVLGPWVINRKGHFTGKSDAQIIAAVEKRSLVFAAMWAVLASLLVMFPDDENLRTLVISTVLVASALGALALIRIPSAALLYSSLTAGSVAMSGISAGGYFGFAIGAIAIIYGILLAVIVVNGYTQALGQASTHVKQIRYSETIKLLLNDFEQGSHDWLWEIDDELGLTYISSYASVLDGRTASEVRGQSLWQLFGAHPAEPCWAILRHAMDENEIIKDLNIPVRTGDDVAWWRVSAKPLFDIDGRFKGYRGVCADVTDQRRYELALRQAKELAERSSAAKSRFLSVMSHELRTPLAAIIGFSELITAPGTCRDIAEARNHAESILKSASNLHGMVNNILDMTRIEAGKVELVEQHVDLVEVMRLVMKKHRPAAQQAGIAITDRYHREQICLNGDLKRLTQIVDELIANAIKFTPGEGSIDIDVGLTGNGHAAVLVSDTGVGIDPNCIERIFKPFEQADNSSTRPFEGSGLGLAIAKQLALLHGGDLTLRSRPGQGTIAELILPSSRIVHTAAEAA